MAKKKKTEKKVKVGTGAFWQLVKAVRTGRLDEKKIKALVSADQKIVAEAMIENGDKKIENADYGLSVTVSQRETPEYDADGIWRDLTSRQRPKCFDRSIDLMVLSPERRKELHDAMVATLTPSEKRACTVDSLNVERLSQAVQDGTIDPEVVAPHVTWKKSAPYITVTEMGSD